jgi:subtilase family serine protease
MFRARGLYATLSSAVLLLCCSLVVLTSSAAGAGPALIREKVDENKLTTLAGNTRPEANAANDLGAVSDNLAIHHMLLQLKRSPQQEQAVTGFVDDLHNPKSPTFHKWLTAVEFGNNFGLADSDVRTVTGWLESQGFTVNSVYPNAMVIDFSGNAGLVRQAFHTSIHNLNVNGVHHIANFSDPQIPAALAPAVAGIVSLHDFRPHKMARAKTAKSRPDYTGTNSGQPFQAMTPADLATIYDFNPLFAKGITGKGQTIVVIEDTLLYSTADWNIFRSTFGLAQYSSGTLTTVQPAPASGSNNCDSPGVTTDDGEAILDAEWATAAAPNAAIVVAACADTDVTSGLLVAGQNLVNGSNPPAIISISYGGCEAESGASSNAALNSLYQQAVAEGISVFVAAGDEGAASCDAGQPSATHGIGVSGTASTAYNVAVGGTDFSDVLNGTTATYWSQTNSATYGSALSYIPEMPWNDSCAGSLLAQYEGYATGFGPGGFCASITNTPLESELFSVAAGSGGPSNCATGVPATFGVSNGSCAGYAKPSWQTGLSGIPNDGVRDIPDVSMFAADGIWGHYAIVCFSDLANGGAACTGDPGSWAGFGGTSLASPVMAGTQALVNQNMGGRQGNPNVVYYALAVNSPNVFHSIAQGDIVVNCSGTEDCYGFLGTIDYGRNGRIFGTTYGGALSVSDSSFSPAYSAGPSWSFASGIGSVDANNLVMNWPAKN